MDGTPAVPTSALTAAISAIGAEAEPAVAEGEAHAPAGPRARKCMLKPQVQGGGVDRTVPRAVG